MFDQFTFHISLASLKSTVLIHFNHTHDDFDRSYPSSMQDAGQVLRWFLSIALRIPTAHDFCVISARKLARARTQQKKFPTS